MSTATQMVMAHARKAFKELRLIEQTTRYCHHMERVLWQRQAFLKGYQQAIDGGPVPAKRLARTLDILFPWPAELKEKG